MTKYHKKNLTIIADDFAMSRGVSSTIIELCKKNCLDGVSVMTTTEYYQEYIERLKRQKIENLKIGLHFDLTFGRSNTRTKKKNNLMLDRRYFSENYFFKVLITSIFEKRQLIRFLLKEMDAQITTLYSDVGRVDFINSHQHVHCIPLIFKITQKLAARHKIKQIRIINESFFSSFSIINPIFIAGIFKFLVLKIFYLINKTKSDTYFYSILYSCRMNKLAVKKIAKLPYKNIEVMFHPGDSDADMKDIFNKEIFHLISRYRDTERKQLETTMLKYKLSLNNSDDKK